MIATIDHALVAFLDEEHSAAKIEAHTDDSAHRSVHALRVTTRGEDGNHLSGLDRLWDVTLR